VSVSHRVWHPPTRLLAFSFGSVNRPLSPLTPTRFYTWIKSRQTGDEWQQKSEPPSDVEAQRLLESDDEELSEKKDAEGAFEKALKSVVREKV
jgi:hypothetical protein